MMKYVVIVLIGLLIGNVIYTYTRILYYKNQLVERNEIIVNVTKKNVELTEHINNLNDSIKRYKHNMNVCTKDNSNLKEIVKKYEIKIKELNNEYNQTKINLENIIKEYEKKIQIISTDNITFTDNVSANVNYVNDLINTIIHDGVVK